MQIGDKVRHYIPKSEKVGNYSRFYVVENDIISRVYLLIRIDSEYNIYVGKYVCFYRNGDKVEIIQDAFNTNEKFSNRFADENIKIYNVYQSQITFDIMYLSNKMCLGEKLPLSVSQYDTIAQHREFCAVNNGEVVQIYVPLGESYVHSDDGRTWKYLVFSYDNHHYTLYTTIIDTKKNFAKTFYDDHLSFYDIDNVNINIIR